MPNRTACIVWPDNVTIKSSAGAGLSVRLLWLRIFCPNPEAEGKRLSLVRDAESDSVDCSAGLRDKSTSQFVTLKSNLS